MIENVIKKVNITRKSVINYIVLAIFGLCFFVSTLLDPCNDETLYKRITIFKIVFGILIVLWILFKFYLEMSRLIKRFRLSYGLVKSYDWFLRIENLWTFIKTFLLIIPFFALDIYWFLTTINKMEDFEIFSLELANSFSGDFLNKFGFLTNQKLFLVGATFMWAVFASLSLATIVYIGYKISMKRFTNRLIKNIEKISNNCKQSKEYKELLGDNTTELNKDKENIEKTCFFIREKSIFIVVKIKFSEMWKDVKKGTWPPRLINFGEY
ncbi:hypothetical protein [Spiroplasma turonicum]|uniref:Transmembrane protein n=1 Tax=Spiroplasma turonicum TaxID=216946 RepID=A0A0K1P619_9MOLU|nr:hypothetical protein [Spiroplasma turonicum]AKU79710.1 hypothetical protein STURON_00464 [Spiroplasma turonicum]ALX70728.1 hypothetical protein STURO_v1c04620 [Spiroplasma turonicum]